MAAQLCWVFPRLEYLHPHASTFLETVASALNKHEEAPTAAERVKVKLLSAELVQLSVNVISLAELLKHRQEVEQLGIVHVVEP